MMHEAVLSTVAVSGATLVATERLVPRRHAKTLASLAAALAALAMTVWRTPSIAARLLNPLGLDARGWLALYAAKSAGLAFIDYAVDWGVKAWLRPEPMPFRKNNPDVRGLAALEGIDRCFLFVNSFVECVHRVY